MIYGEGKRQLWINENQSIYNLYNKKYDAQFPNCLIILYKFHLSWYFAILILGPVVQSVVSLTSLLRVISLTVLADSIHNICWKNVSNSHFFSKIFQHICISLDVNLNESLTNDVVSFEQLGPDHFITCWCVKNKTKNCWIDGKQCRPWQLQLFVTWYSI